MKRAITLGIGALALAGMTLPTSAADLGARPYTKGPVAAPVPVFTWTGCYIGGNVGWGFGDNDVRVAVSPDPASQAFIGPAFTAGAIPALFPLEMDGIIGGGQIGCNYQTGSFVFGIEGDIQASDVKDALAVTTNVPGFVTGQHFASQSLDWFGTVRGRLGFAWGQFMVYGTGGVAFGRVNYGLGITFPATNDFQNIAVRDTETGWTAGAGFEWAFAPQWSVKAEYLFIDLGDRAFATIGSGRAPNLTTSLIGNFENQYNIARVGVNYRFGSGF
jgi:outer membrane immunogenic protein